MKVVGLFSSGIRNQRAHGNLQTSLPLIAWNRYDDHDARLVQTNPVHDSQSYPRLPPPISPGDIIPYTWLTRTQTPSNLLFASSLCWKSTRHGSGARSRMVLVMVELSSLTLPSACLHLKAYFTIRTPTSKQGPWQARCPKLISLMLRPRHLLSPTDQVRSP